MQEEYNNGFVSGVTPKHTYFYFDSVINPVFLADEDTIYIISGGSIYSRDMGYGLYSYNITTKELKYEGEFPFLDGTGRGCYFDGWFYGSTGRSGEYMKWKPDGESKSYSYNSGCYLFESGFLDYDKDTKEYILLSLDFEPVGTIPLPQREVEHGILEPVGLELGENADGTVYAITRDTSDTRNLYRLDIDALEWTDLGDMPVNFRGGEASGVGNRQAFCGRYVSCFNSNYEVVVCDYIMGEQVFEYGDLYVCERYFGGDQYLGVGGGEYRWVNLSDLTMSETLPFPENVNDDDMWILNDTYCVYTDKYGLFLWNYNTGEEETIKLYEN